MANELTVTKELIEVIATEMKVVAQSHLQIAEQLLVLAGTAPSADSAIKSEVKEPVKADKKAPAKEEAEETESEVVMIEFEGKEVDIESLTVVKLKKLAKEAEIDISELGSKPKKADLIALILEALEDEEGEEEETEEEEAETTEEETEEEESEEEEDDSEEEEGEEEEEVALEDMTVNELKEYITEELEEDAPKKKAKEKPSAYKARLIEFIEEHLPEEEEEEEEEGDVEESETTITYEDENEEEVTVDLEELSLKEIKSLAKEFDLKVTAKKKDEAIEQFLEQWDDAEEEDAEEEEEEDGDIAEELGLNDWTVEELAETLADAGLSTKGKKQALIDRIVKAVEDGEIEFEDDSK